MSFTADALYGPNLGSTQGKTVDTSGGGAASGAATPTHPSGTPAPTTRTVKPQGQAGFLHDPLFALVALLGIGILILHLSFRGSIQLRAGAGTK